ncbi:hypothetical protein BDDG_00386 [Blastomyces dermatitidis ATCC 18188]|uniref:Uncharacterized protein n=1 Tax=Ajellomyces dermatitidis (strain ATCC 18188 / CBS 674.68) TaxID=653446 RepID=F2T1W5_AJEDA|nr:hypothetical protein BDDG_00386 [Blastomyces dermatitidis ATCC 18188]
MDLAWTECDGRPEQGSMERAPPKNQCHESASVALLSGAYVQDGTIGWRKTRLATDLHGQSASIRKFLLPMIPPLVSRQPIKLPGQAAASVLHSSDYWTFSDFSGDANMGGGHLREIRCHDSKERAASCGQFPALVASCIPRIEFLSALENT